MTIFTVSAFAVNGLTQGGGSALLRLADVGFRLYERFTYEYDFTSCWIHVTVRTRPLLIRERDVSSHGSVGELRLPRTRRKFDDVFRRMLAHALQHIDQVSVDIDVDELAGRDQALDCCRKCFARAAANCGNSRCRPMAYLAATACHAELRTDSRSGLHAHPAVNKQ